MNLVLFHLVAYVATGVLSNVDNNVLSPNYCSVSSISSTLLPPDLGDFTSSYGGESMKFADCEGLPIFGGSFVEDSLTRFGKAAESFLDSTACCVSLKCGPYNDGYCATKGSRCNADIVPYDSHWCPGSYSQCCPDPARVQPGKVTPNSLTENVNNLFAPENSASPGITGGAEIALGNLNLDDWTTTPLESENLFLTSDNADNYGLIAGLGDSTEWGFESTA